MRTIRSSRTTTVLAVLGAVALLAGTAVAVTVVASDVPEESKVGEPMKASANVTDLYQGDFGEGWTLVLETELDSPRWTITYYDQTGARLNVTNVTGTKTVTGKAIEPPIDTVEIAVTGDTPQVEEWTYEQNETFQGLRIAQSSGGTDETVEEWQVIHYTDQSRQARQALDAAKQAMAAANESGATSLGGAVSNFNNARKAYNGGNFGLAQDLASKAKQKADDARAAAEQTTAVTTQSEDSGGLPLVPIVGVVVLLVLVAGGGFYYLQQGNQQDTKLR